MLALKNSITNVYLHDSIKFSEVKTFSGSANLKRGVLVSIIEEAKTRFNLPNFMINSTNKGEARKFNCKPQRHCISNGKVEMHALDIICQMAELRQPLTP